MSDSVLDNLICAICLDYAQDPVAASCCEALYCKKCSQSLDIPDKCPLCRSKCTFRESVLARRLINSIQTNCEHCDFQCTIGDLKDHLKRCDRLTITCPIHTCNNEIERSKMFDHLKDSHNDKLFDKIDNILNIFKSNNLEDLNNNNISNHNMISIDKKTNKFGNQARLGSNGKYFCGKRLDGPNCHCCNGFCGPTTGCNCSGCMELDLKSRKLPNGWLVNNSGFSSRKSNGLFYCGRLVLRGVRGCDGYCGPTNGPQCSSCKTLNEMTTPNGRYFDLIEHN